MMCQGHHRVVVAGWAGTLTLTNTLLEAELVCFASRAVRRLTEDRSSLTSKRTPWRTEETRDRPPRPLSQKTNPPTVHLFYQRYPALTVHHHRDLLEWIGVESWNRASDVHFHPTDTLADLPHFQLLLQCVAYKFLLLLFSNPRCNVSCLTTRPTGSGSCLLPSFLPLPFCHGFFSPSLSPLPPWYICSLQF